MLTEGEEVYLVEVAMVGFVAEFLVAFEGAFVVVVFVGFLGFFELLDGAIEGGFPGAIFDGGDDEGEESLGCEWGEV